MPKKKPLKSSPQRPSDEANDSHMADSDELETISDTDELEALEHADEPETESDTDELEALENADSQVDADSNRGYDPYNNVKK